LKKMREASRQWPAGSDTAEARVVTSLTADAVRTLYSLGRELSSTIARSDAAAIVAAAARRLVPAALCVFYDYDARSETLTAVAASGDDGPLLGGLRMPVGERLSGWVAANRRPMVNADPMLDLHDTAAAKLPLKSCLSLPLLSNGQLLAVLTLYADVESAFEGSQQALLELVGPEVAESLARAPHQP